VEAGEVTVTPRTETVWLCLDGAVQRDLEQAQRQLQDASKDDALDSGAGQLREKVADLERRAAESTRPFEVYAVSWRQWRELKEQHPPTADQAKRMLVVGLVAPYNDETFVPEAIAACCVQFRDAEQVARAADDGKLTHGQVVKLFRAVRQLNEGDNAVPPVRGG
jgi:hypothetical protein